MAAGLPATISPTKNPRPQCANFHVCLIYKQHLVGYSKEKRKAEESLSMLRFLFGWNGQQATFKPYKQHSGSKRQHLSGTVKVNY